MSRSDLTARSHPSPMESSRTLLVQLFGLVVAAALLAVFPVRPLFAQMHYGPHTPPPTVASAPVPERGQVVLGDVVPFGAGTARAWVDLGTDGTPKAIGITLTEAALEGLPAKATPGLIWMVEYVVDLPDVPLLPFDHVGVNWNPHGHDPSGVYNIPHFDFHFYQISPDERRRITARGDDLGRCQKVPVAGLLPEGYVYAVGAEEPGMGGHWADPTSHEFHGQHFTSTFIFGAYDGDVIFWEPMITKAYLESKPDIDLPLRIPAAYAEDGYYPTSYSIRYDEARKEYTIALEGLTLRQRTAAR